MKCPRCAGLMQVKELCYRGDACSSWGCINCGELVDPVILKNRAYTQERKKERPVNMRVKTKSKCNHLYKVEEALFVKCNRPLEHEGYHRCKSKEWATFAKEDFILERLKVSKIPL